MKKFFTLITVLSVVFIATFSCAPSGDNPYSQCIDATTANLDWTPLSDSAGCIVLQVKDALTVGQIGTLHNNDFIVIVPTTFITSLPTTHPCYTTTEKVMKVQRYSDSFRLIEPNVDCCTYWRNLPDSRPHHASYIFWHCAGSSYVRFDRIF